MNPRAGKNRTVDADSGLLAAKLKRAQEHFRAAESLRELGESGNSVVTLYINTAVSAADVICGSALGHYSQGSDHAEAVRLLRSVDTEAAKHLERILHMKFLANYGYELVKSEEVLRAQRSAQALLNRAEQR